MANESTGENASDLREELRGAVGGAKEAIADAADQAKSKGVDQISGMAGAVHGAADELSRELPQAAGYIHALAGRLEQASSELRERSVEDLASGFSNFARRQPAAAFAGSVLAGFALSRFLKSSAPRSEHQREQVGEGHGSSSL